MERIFEVLWGGLGTQNRGPQRSGRPQLGPRRLSGGDLGAKVASKSLHKPSLIDFWSVLEPKMEAKTLPKPQKINVKSDNDLWIDFSSVFDRFLNDFGSILDRFFDRFWIDL